MISRIFHTIFYQPLYNAFVTLFDLFPWFDAGVIVIILTILVRLILFPLSKKSVVTQLRMREIEPEIKRIREKYKDKAEQARHTMDLYKEKGVNPFAGVFLILIQLPIIFALYFVFIKTGLPQINEGLLYGFVPVPDKVNMEFLGIIDISKKNIFLALLAALSTYFQARLATPIKKTSDGTGSFQEQFARSMSMQMKYVFPVIVFLIAYKISGVVALYWFVSNLFTIGQELVIRRRLSKEGGLVAR